MQTRISLIAFVPGEFTSSYLHNIHNSISFFRRYSGERNQNKLVRVRKTYTSNSSIYSVNVYLGVCKMTGICIRKETVEKRTVWIWMKLGNIYVGKYEWWSVRCDCRGMVGHESDTKRKSCTYAIVCLCKVVHTTHKYIYRPLWGI